MKIAAPQNTPRGIDWSMIQPNISGEMIPLMLKPVETMPKARPAAPGGDHVLPEVHGLPRIEAGFGGQLLPNNIGLALLLA